jgi:hypothetical protein
MSPCVGALRDERGFGTRANRNSTQNFHTAPRAAYNQRIISYGRTAPALELWDQNVAVEAGQMTQLPLSAANSKVKPDQFPGPAPK